MIKQQLLLFMPTRSQSARVLFVGLRAKDKIYFFMLQQKKSTAKSRWYLEFTDVFPWIPFSLQSVH